MIKNIEDLNKVVEGIKVILKTYVNEKINLDLNKIEVKNDKPKGNEYDIVYIFTTKEEGNVIKVGKDTSENFKRFNNYHYNVAASMSVLAKSLLIDYIENKENSILGKKEENRNALKCIDNYKITSEFRNGRSYVLKEIKNNENLKKARKYIQEWMKNEDNLNHYYIKIPKKDDKGKDCIIITNFIEAYLQMQLTPKFEGYRPNQKVKE